MVAINVLPLSSSVAVPPLVVTVALVCMRLCVTGVHCEPRLKK